MAVMGDAADSNDPDGIAKAIDGSLSPSYTRSFGLNIDKIAALIKRISAKYTILMVEHNLSVVANLSDIITVLTRGHVLAEGTYIELAKDERVKEAYLGAGHG